MGIIRQSNIPVWSRGHIDLAIVSMLITIEATNIDQPAKESARREERRWPGQGPADLAFTEWNRLQWRWRRNCQRGGRERVPCPERQGSSRSWSSLFGEAGPQGLGSGPCSLREVKTLLLLLPS